MSDTRVSVALCTYQGESFLKEQLNSIAAQTGPPSEVIVCDDGSTDSTMEMLRRFRSQASFPVRLSVNQERLGPTKNFERAIALCEGDIIFLSDQDDVWQPQKLEVLTAVLATSPDIGAVFSNAEVVDERLSPRGYSVWDAVGFTPALQKRFVQDGALDVLLKRNVVGGMTLGFRSQFRDLIVPMPAGWYHDCWIPLLIAAVGDVAMVPDRLVKYRQHERQKIGLSQQRLGKRVADKRNVSRSAFLREADHYAAAYERLMTRRTAYACSSRDLHRLEAKIRHIRARADMKGGNGRLRLLMREVFACNYQRFSSGWRSIAVDAFLS